MSPTLALLGSPLLGPSVWRPVAEVLARHGGRAVTCAAPATAQTSGDVLDGFAKALPTDRDLVLVAHSNAGAYVPPLLTGRRVTGVVFVDAVLPPPRGRTPLAPPTLLEFLRRTADANGLLPGWTHWWDEDEVALLFPDAETRGRVEREQPRLPLSYFMRSVAATEGWDRCPGAYLAFGDTYSAERDRAERRGWPVTTLSGQHLHLLVDPEEVAAHLGVLIGRLVI